MHVKVSPLTYELPRRSWLLVGVAFAVVLLAFYSSVLRLTETWFTREEYSHGVLIPLIAAFLIWQRRDEIARAKFSGSWAGVALVLLGCMLKIVGDIGLFYILQQYALLITIYGLALALVGWRTFKLLAVPLLLLLFMIPLPEFFLQNLSARLQLISSQIGVLVIKAFGISVFVEGNVIDLGGYQLQVAEACSGLRYLFPLMTLGFMMAYLFKVAMWKRVVLFLSSIPLTVLMNSFRIGVIGVLVEHYGIAMAEGFLHDFEGWVVFMACTALMLLEVVVLARIGRDSRPWREVFGWQGGNSSPSAERTLRPMPWSFVAGAVLLIPLFGATLLLPQRTEYIPPRQAFVSFPSELEGWKGRRQILDSVYLDTLKLDDYLYANFGQEGGNPVNLLVAWYDTQTEGRTTHSPRTCLPGGGWRIVDLREVIIPDTAVAGAPLRANRVEIQLGEQKALVYYWFQQRGRVVTNEYAAKWYLFWDSLIRRRTDGALVRLVLPVSNAGGLQHADAELAKFAQAIVPRLTAYVPG